MPSTEQFLRRCLSFKTNLHENILNSLTTSFENITPLCDLFSRCSECIEKLSRLNRPMFSPQLECISVHVGQAEVQMGNANGSSTAWSMGSSQTDRCPVTKPSAEEMTPSTPSSVRLGLESMSPELCLWTWNPQSSVRFLFLIE